MDDDDDSHDDDEEEMEEEREEEEQEEEEQEGRGCRYQVKCFFWNLRMRSLSGSLNART